MKVPRRVTLNESDAFFSFFMDFWERYHQEFPHIKVKDIFFVKDDEQSTVPNERYMKIAVASRETQLLIPDAKYILVVFKAFNYISQIERDYHFYNCLYKIPVDYLQNPRLRFPDIVAHAKVMEKFQGKIILGRG